MSHISHKDDIPAPKMKIGTIHHQPRELFMAALICMVTRITASHSSYFPLPLIEVVASWHLPPPIILPKSISIPFDFGSLLAAEHPAVSSLLVLTNVENKPSLACVIGSSNAPHPTLRAGIESFEVQGNADKEEKTAPWI